MSLSLSVCCSRRVAERENGGIVSTATLYRVTDHAYDVTFGTTRSGRRNVVRVSSFPAIEEHALKTISSHVVHGPFTCGAGISYPNFFLYSIIQISTTLSAHFIPSLFCQSNGKIALGLAHTGRGAGTAMRQRWQHTSLAFSFLYLSTPTQRWRFTQWSLQAGAGLFAACSKIPGAPI
ncbi:hypothetical protein PoB_000536800 [Plakobranchus ocellatus]|uniref:Uncharacterized protein n=1 Tax=Plakobranchus ocellatus TaxID=259542 RepID=A0AAV3Y9P3_9GAST|nr:hypothetical protein PoB_000536800 [Plakobranchus ocellatus]